MQTLILASSSPRRKELLQNLHLQFQTLSSEADETFDPKISPSEVVMELAQRKAQSVFRDNRDAYVIGSDTHCSGKRANSRQT